MKKYLLVLILGSIYLITIAQTNNFERLTAIVTRNTASSIFADKFNIVDSVKYVYDNNNIGGGIEQKFNYLKLDSTNFISLNKYVPYSQLGLINDFKSEIIRDSVTNTFTFREQKSVDIYKKSWNIISEKIYQFDEHENIVYNQISNYIQGVFKNATATSNEFNSNGKIIGGTNWAINDKKEKSISSTFKNIYNSFGLIDSVLFYSNSNTLVSASKYNYDSKNRQIDYINYSISLVTGKYILYNGNSIVFDDLDSSIIYLSFLINNFKKDTTQHYKSISKYDDHGNLIYNKRFYWNKSEQKWIDNFEYKYEFLYDENDNLIKKINSANVYSVQDSAYVWKSGEVYSAKYIDNKLIEEYNVNNGIKYRNLFYNENGNLREEILSKYVDSCNCLRILEDKKYYWEKYLNETIYVDEKVFTTSIYPNPFSSQINILFSAESTIKSIIVVYNSIGHIVDRKYFISDVGMNNYHYNSSNLSSGKYLIMLKVGNETKFLSVLKN